MRQWVYSTLPKSESRVYPVAKSRIAEAQEDLYQARMKEYYMQQERGEGEGLNQPIRYGVWVVLGK